MADTIIVDVRLIGPAQLQASPEVLDAELKAFTDRMQHHGLCVERCVVERNRSAAPRISTDPTIPSTPRVSVRQIIETSNRLPRRMRQREKRRIEQSLAVIEETSSHFLTSCEGVPAEVRQRICASLAELPEQKKKLAGPTAVEVREWVKSWFSGLGRELIGTAAGGTPAKSEGKPDWQATAWLLEHMGAS